MKYQPPYGVSDPDAPYINGDPSIAQQGSILPAAAAEFPQREIVNLIASSDMVPADNDLFQLTRSVRHQWVNFCVDTGSANALSVALTPSLTAYKQGVPLRVLVKSDNTGPSTINVNGLGNRPVVRASGAALGSGDLKTGMIALLVDDGTRFQLVNFLGAAGVASNIYVKIPYAEDSTAPADPNYANKVTGIYVPAITTAVSGDLVLIKIKNLTNNGAVQFVVNNMAAVPIVRNDGQPLQGFDLNPNEILLLVYNVNQWQVLRMVRSQVYFKLSADLILYVRTDGNDTTGDGSLNDAAHAFRTVQRAVDFVKASWLIGGRMVTIQLGIPGTYVGRTNIQALAGRLVVRGDPNNIAGYVMQGNSVPNAGCAFGAAGSGIDVTLQGITISGTLGAHNLIEVNYGATLTTDNIALAGVTTTGAGISNTAATSIHMNYIHCKTNMAALFSSGLGATITMGAWFTAIYSYGEIYSGAFAIASGLGMISIPAGYVNFIGIAYGYRALAYNNSVILTNGAALPGNMAGGADASSVIT